MKERLILDNQYTIEGWKMLPYALCNAKTGKAIFLNKKQFDLLLMCSGKKEIDVDSLNDDLKRFLKSLKSQKIIHSAQENETRNLYYKHYDNIYKRNVHWSITGKCNYRCRHCFQSAPCGK